MEKIYAKHLTGVAASIKIKNDIYFHESYGNRIFRYSLKSEKFTCVARSNLMSGCRLGYMGTAQYNSSIYFFPYYAKKICIYDVQQNSLTYRECQYRYITKAVSYGEKIFFWANEQNIVAYYDIEQDTLGEIELPDGMLVNAGCGGGIENNGKLYIPAKEKGMIACVDIQALSVQMLAIADTEMIFETIDFDGESFWLSGTEKKIIKWNLLKDEKEIYYLEDLEDREIAMPWASYFYTSKIFDGFVYFAPLKAKQLIRLHVQSGKKESVLEMRENEITMLMEVWKDRLYFSCKNIYDGIALMDCLIDKNGCVIKEKILYGEQDYNYVMQEHNEESLRNFIRQITGGYHEERYFK